MLYRKVMDIRRLAEEAPARNVRSAGGRAACPVEFGKLSLVFDASGVAFAPESGTLIVSDLHLEKGSRAAARGSPVPAFDSHDTLLRLHAAIVKYRPLRVICLGDSFDDRRAEERMFQADRFALAALCALVKQWVWISGNHDPHTPAFCEGERAASYCLEGVIVRHQPLSSSAPQIVGHFHPKSSVSAGGNRFSGACFCMSEDMLVMPAFGAYTGGLACSHPAITALHASPPRIFMSYRGKLWRTA